MLGIMAISGVFLFARRQVAVFVGALALAGCGGAGASAAGSGGAAGTAGAAGGAGAAAGGAGGSGGVAPCSEPASEIPAGATCIHHVTGRTVDGTGAPLPDVSISVCGRACYPGKSGADARFSVDINRHITLAATSVLVHERPLKAGFYFQLPSAPGPDLDVGDTPVLALPEGPALVVKPDGSPQQSVTSGDVTLNVPAGVEVNLDFDEAAAGAAGKEFRALPVPKNLWNDFVDPSLGLSGLYAFGPFEATFVDVQTGKLALAQMSFANTAGLPASTPVEFLELGSFLYPDPIPTATWGTVATGTVSADGKTIDMDPGTGIRYITWIGIREKK